MMVFIFLFVVLSGCVTFRVTDAEPDKEQQGTVKEIEVSEKEKSEKECSESELLQVGDEFLPIGTVLKIEGLEHQPVMIYGRIQRQGGTEKIWDYVGVPYPQGNISEETNVFFNHDLIVEILHKGLVTDEEIEFREDLKELGEEVI